MKSKKKRSIKQSSKKDYLLSYKKWLVTGILFVAIIMLYFVFHTSISQQNILMQNPTKITAVLPTPPDTSYTSSALGISFNYIPVLPNGQYFFTKEISNTVYLYWIPGSDKPFSGTDSEFLRAIAPGSKYVEVFTVDPHKTIYEILQEKFLAGYSQNDCFLRPPSGPPSGGFYQWAYLDFHRNSNDTPEQIRAEKAKCPKYVTGIGLRYFLMNSEYPEKLLFINIGQDNLLSGFGNETWDQTIKIFN